MTRDKTSPEDTRRIVTYALEHLQCQDCGAAPREPRTEPGPGRSTCKARFAAAAIATKQSALSICVS